MDRGRLLRETFLSDIVWMEQASSTNTLALTAPLESELPLLLGADRQEGGRGRGSNRWWSTPGALTFSLVLAPEALGIPQARWPALSLTVGLAVCQTLELDLPQHSVQLKWPNDVFVDGRKICGILIESAADRPGRLVIGIGLNVNNSLSQAPAELQQSAVSLVDLLSAPQDRERILVLLLQHLEQQLSALAGNDPALPDRWRHRCFLTGREVVISDPSGDTRGLCLGIDGDAALRLQTSGGAKRLFAGTVQLIDDRSAR